MAELLLWLDLNSAAKGAAALKSANALLCLYIISYALNRKAAFIVAFLLTEFYGLSLFSDKLNNINFYLGYAFIYSVLYYYLYIKNEKILTLAAVVLIISLDAGSAADAWIYPEDETYFYKAYPFLYVFVHICLIVSLINWRVFRSIMGAAIDSFFGLLGTSYRVSFFWYTLCNFSK